MITAGRLVLKQPPSNRAGHVPTPSFSLRASLGTGRRGPPDMLLNTAGGGHSCLVVGWVGARRVSGLGKNLLLWSILCSIINAPPDLDTQVHASPCCFVCSRSCCCLAPSRPAWREWCPRSRPRTTRKVTVCSIWAGSLMSWSLEYYYIYK